MEREDMEPIPITILAGSDRRAGTLPESGAGLHPLATYKSVHLKVGGRPLVAILAERLLASGGFAPVTIAGPSAVHEGLGVDVELVDTDGSVATNLRAAFDHHRARGRARVAVMACDVLPTVEELAELRAAYEADAPCALWFPLVRRPDDESKLGSFAWKPRYDLVPPGASRPVHVLPGHLGVLEPAALRVDLTLELMDIAYRTRNRDIDHRGRVMALGILGRLLKEDLRRLVRLRPPVVTWHTLSTGFRVARFLKRGTLAIDELERRIGRVFLTDARRSDAGTPRGIRYPLSDLLSLAEDVDTAEEAADLHLDA